MDLFIPHYYRQFHCLAGKCPDSCCKEWEIDLDEKTEQFYQTLPGALGDTIRENLCVTSEGTGFRLTKQNRCPMWRQDGLCEIQKQLGHSALSAVCQQYPRIRHDFGDFMEYGLELSCPEAARLILTLPYQYEKECISPESEPDYDTELMNILCESRKNALFLLNGPTYSLPQKLSILLLYGSSVQTEIDGGEPAIWDPGFDLQDALFYAKQGDCQPVFPFFKKLEILTRDWEEFLNAPHTDNSWTSLHTALARYLIYRYWYQAVNDYDLMSRIKFVVISCLLVNGLGTDTLRIAQLFSKEIENDPDNLNTILDSCYTHPLFTDMNLLSLLAATDAPN